MTSVNIESEKTVLYHRSNIV